MGIAISIFQLSSSTHADLGVEPNQWDIASRQHTVPAITTNTSSWDTLDQYLPILAAMGFKHLRLSVEWNYIEPQRGIFNYLALCHYQKVIGNCLRYGIEPMLTFYHFTQPLWFMNLGGFERDENIPYFTDYCEKVFRFLGHDVKIWCSINEPAVESFMGYILGLFPPHQRLQFHRAATVLANLLKAHVQICMMVEKLSGGGNHKIGLVHNVLQFESQSLLISKLITEPLTHFTNELVMHFLKAGEFNYKGVYYQDQRYKGNCSFVNIYGRVQIGYTGTTCQKHQQMGDMHIAIYPQSYSEALNQAACLNLPIYITETGIADQQDIIRPEFIIKFLRVVIDKLACGMSIERIYFWTMKDNYEWHRGNQIQFGLFNENNIPRSSAYLFEWVIKKFKEVLLQYQDPNLIIEQWRNILDLSEQKIEEGNVSFFEEFCKQQR